MELTFLSFITSSMKLECSYGLASDGLLVAAAPGKHGTGVRRWESARTDASPRPYSRGYEDEKFHCRSFPWQPRSRASVEAELSGLECAYISAFSLDRGKNRQAEACTLTDPPGHYGARTYASGKNGPECPVKSRWDGPPV